MATTTFLWTDSEVRAALGLRPELARPGLVFEGVSTDSRTVRPGELYVALVGERFDGHRFVAEAIGAGARAAVVSKPVAGADGAAVYPVDDTLMALGRLAAHRRRALPATVVGVGGSAGKTSTKELLKAALGTRLSVHATEANFNNRIGVPLTLLSAPADADIVVLEMGTSETGEMAALGTIAEPDIGVLVTVGEEHLTGLGSREAAVEEELDLLRALRPGGWAVVGDTPADLPESARAVLPSARVAGISVRSNDELRVDGVTADAWGRHSFEWRGRTVTLGQAGRHVIVNALLALVVAEELGVDLDAAADALSQVGATRLRGEIVRVGGLSLVLDCYNANPQSLTAALDLLESRSVGSGRVAFLGSMLELGSRSDELHRDALVNALERDLDIVVATGAFAQAAVGLDVTGPAELIVVASPEEAYRQLRERLHGSEEVLLKGSRGVALERLVGRFEGDFGEGV